MEFRKSGYWYDPLHGSPFTLMVQGSRATRGHARAAHLAIGLLKQSARSGIVDSEYGPRRVGLEGWLW